MLKKERNGLSSAELSNFCGQVALILEAGLPLYDGMETLAGADSGSAHADVYSAASKGVTETGSLYDAIKDDGRWPKYLVEMVGIGERSGQLDQVMRGLEAYYAREDRIRSSISSAVTYPLVLGVMLIVIVLILLWKVLPVFRRVLNSMGVGLSESGGLLMRLGVSVGWIILALVALVVVLVITGVVLMRTKHRDKVMQIVQRVMPSLQRLNKKLSASRVASVLSMMLSSGFPTDEALEMTSNVLSDRNAAEKVLSIRKSLEDGSAFADAVTKTNLFEDLHNRMITMGSATGQEDQVLGKLASLYEEQVEDGITRLVAIIEPTLVALLSVVIGAVLLSVMLPMAGILTSL
ncbi:MAG: type II secretion system F family protein [Clostridia bacterium]|nr:type II secretion system F family protein [Clostridia bacterium]MBR0218539.1 type II secretion system F family protein [Clostridia bacterium]